MFSWYQSQKHVVFELLERIQKVEEQHWNLQPGHVLWTQADPQSTIKANKLCEDPKEVQQKPRQLRRSLSKRIPTLGLPDPQTSRSVLEFRLGWIFLMTLQMIFGRHTIFTGYVSQKTGVLTARWRFAVGLSDLFKSLWSFIWFFCWFWELLSIFDDQGLRLKCVWFPFKGWLQTTNSFLKAASAHGLFGIGWRSFLRAFHQTLQLKLDVLLAKAGSNYMTSRSSNMFKEYTVATISTRREILEFWTGSTFGSFHSIFEPTPFGVIVFRSPLEGSVRNSLELGAPEAAGIESLPPFSFGQVCFASKVLLS